MTDHDILSHTTTHIAGKVVHVNNRTIQRCAVCGEKLIDSKNCAMAVNPDGTLDPIPTWEVGRLVRVIPGNPIMFEQLDDTSGQLPIDSCIDLVE